jgi:hypothetical protein
MSKQQLDNLTSYELNIWDLVKNDRENGIKEITIYEEYHNEIDNELLHDMVFVWDI